MSMMWLAREFCKWFLPSWQEGQRGPEWGRIMLRGTTLLKQAKCAGKTTHNLNVWDLVVGTWPFHRDRFNVHSLLSLLCRTRVEHGID